MIQQTHCFGLLSFSLVKSPSSLAKDDERATLAKTPTHPPANPVAPLLFSRE